MEYYFRVRQDGIAKTGLSPDFEYLLTTGGVCGGASEAGTDKSASAPTIYEVGGGVYKFDIEFGTAPWDVETQGLVGVIDADPTGAAGLTDDERYIDIALPLLAKAWEVAFNRLANKSTYTVDEETGIGTEVVRNLADTADLYTITFTDAAGVQTRSAPT